MRIFEDDEDYETFQRIRDESRERYDTRLLDFCLMPNYWHLSLLPVKGGELSQSMGSVTLTRQLLQIAVSAATSGQSRDRFAELNVPLVLSGVSA